jgi:RNA polymerase sigma-70 factor, ECF subfamily
MRAYDKIYEELLVLDCLAGSREAFNALVERWQERLFRHAWKLTGNEEAAWDAVQETWLAVVKGIKRLKGPDAFPGWIYGILGNKCADWVRKQKRDRKLLGKLSSEEADLRADILRLRLWDALLRLSDDHRLVVVLRYVEGHSVKETARIMDIPEGTVKSRLHVARGRLKEHWEVLEND